MRLAPFLSMTSLGMRLNDPQQSERFALDLSAAIAEARGAGNQDVPLMEDPRITPAFLALFERTVIRGSAWSMGAVWPLTDGNAELYLHMDKTGFVLVDVMRSTRRRVYVTIPQQQGMVSLSSDSISNMTGGAAELAANSQSVVDSPRLLTSSEAVKIRSIADASLPFFFVQSASSADPTHLVLLCVRPDGVRLRAVWAKLDINDISSAKSMKCAPIIEMSVDLQDTLPAHSVSQSASKEGTKKSASGKATESTRDLDRYCSGCGTFLTAPLVYPLPTTSQSASLVLPPSHVQLNSPGVISFIRCTHPICEKQKLLLCIPCQQLGSYPPPHDEGHILVRIENAHSKEGSTPTDVTEATVVVSTHVQTVLAMFDVRDDLLVLAPFVPFSSTATGSAASVRALDFRCFSAQTGAFLAAPMPQSNAVALYLHCPVSDDSLCPPFTNPRAAEATIFKINRAGILSRSMWTHKLHTNPRQSRNALLFQLPSAETSSLDVLSLLISQILQSVCVADQNQELLLGNFGRVSIVVTEVGRLYRTARRNSSSFATQEYFIAVERIFRYALHLLSAYLTHLSTIWPLIRSENPITSRSMHDALQTHKRELKMLLIDQLLMGLLHEHESAPQQHTCGIEVQLLLVHLSSFVAFWFDTWLQRLTFIRMIIDALPSSRGIATGGGSATFPSDVSDESSLPHFALQHLLHIVLLKNWNGNPAAHSASPTEHAVFVEFEMNSADMALQASSIDDTTSVPVPHPSAVAGSIFGAPFSQLLDGLIEYLWSTPTQTSPAQLVILHFLLAFEFHLARVVPSPLALAHMHTLSNGGTKLSNHIPGSTQVQFSQAKPSAALLVRICTKVLAHFSDAIFTQSNEPVRIAYPMVQLYAFSALQLARTNLKLVAATEISALLPVLFNIIVELEEQFHFSAVSNSNNNSRVEIEFARQILGTLPSTHIMPNSSIRLMQVGSLIKTAFVSLLHVLYPQSAEESSFESDVETSTAYTESDGNSSKLALNQHLVELANIASIPLAPHLQQFLRKFVSSSKDIERKSPSPVAFVNPTPLAPEIAFSELVQQCLLEMGGGASQLDLTFAWPMEAATVACVMRYTLVSEGNNAAELRSPRKGDTVQSASHSSSLLVELAYHFSLSLDIHLLLSKAKKKNMRILAQADCPLWLHQLISRVFELSRMHLLGKMRTQPNASPSPDMCENKDAADTQPAPSMSPPVLIEGSPSPDFTANGKLQADTSTRTFVAQWLQNANFLLASDFSGAYSSNTSSADSTSASFRLTPIRVQLASPSNRSPAPLMSLERDVSLIPMDSLHNHAVSSFLVAASGAVTDDEEESDDDEKDVPLLRSLSDRIPSSSPSMNPASSAVFGRTLAAPEVTSASSSALSSPASSMSASTAAHALFVRRTRRFALHGSSGWLFTLIQNLTPRDRIRVEDFRLARQNAFQLTQARVDLLRLLSAHLGAHLGTTGNSTDTLRTMSDGTVARASPTESQVMPLCQLSQTSIGMDLFLPMLWFTLSTHNGLSVNHIPSSTVSNLRIHVLYPSGPIAQLNEKVASGNEHQTTLIDFLRLLASWLDTTLIALDDANDNVVSFQSSLVQTRLRFVLHFLCQEFYSTTRDKSTLLHSGILASLVRFAFHPKAVVQLNELTRIAWTSFSWLVANVLAPINTNSKEIDSMYLSSYSSLTNAVRPLQDVILQHLSAISTSIPFFKAFQLLPPAELLAQAQRIVPAPLDLDSIKVGTLLDAQDRAQSWFCAQVKKIEQRVGGTEVWVAFSGWPESQNEWIPLKSGKLSALFSHVDVMTEANSRPNKHRLPDLNAAIFEFKSRQAKPISDVSKQFHKTHLADVQQNINERIVVAINMIRILRAVAPMNAVSFISPTVATSPRLIPVPTSASASTVSSLCMLSSFLRMLTDGPATRSLPMILQLELFSFLRRSIGFRYAPADFDTTAATNGACMNAEQVVRAILQLVGSTIWTVRPLSTQPTMSAVHSAFPPDSLPQVSATSEGSDDVSLQQSWLWQCHFESCMNITDGHRRLQEASLQFIHDCWLSTALAPDCSGNRWGKILISLIQQSVNTLSTVESTLLSRYSHQSVPNDSLGLMDASFFQLHSSLKLLSGLSSLLRQGSRISVRLSDTSENVDLDSHQISVTNSLEPTCDVHSTRIDAFDLSNIMHGYVRSFKHSPVGTLGCTPFLTVEVQRELDPAADPSNLNANATDLLLQGNSAYNAESAAIALGASSTITYSTVPFTISSVRPLPARHLHTRNFVSNDTNTTMQTYICEILQHAVLRNDTLHLPQTSASVQLLQFQFECLRVLQSQLSTNGWKMDPNELVSLLFTLHKQTAPFPPSTIDLDVSHSLLPRTDLCMQALTIRNSRNFQLEQEMIHSANHMQIPPSFLSLPTVPTHSTPIMKQSQGAQATPVLSSEPDVAQPLLLSAIEQIVAMGYSEQQARAALIHTGSADMVGAMELILNEHPAASSVITDVQWNDFVERQGASLQIERYLRQQALKVQGVNGEPSVPVTDTPMNPAVLPPRPSNFDGHSIFLGPSITETNEDTTSHRIPLYRSIASGRNVVGLSVMYKQSINTSLPNCTLQHGIIVKVMPSMTPGNGSISVPGLSDKEQLFSPSDSLCGVVLVRFNGSLRSTQPVPAVYAWLPITELVVNPLSPFDISAQAMVCALQCTREELEQRARHCCVEGMHRVTKLMLAQVIRQAMRPTVLPSSISLPRFSLLQILEVLPVLTHPIDSMPALVKPVSKHRLQLCEQISAYLLRNNNDSTAASSTSFDCLMHECEQVLHHLSLSIDVHVSIPQCSSLPLCLKPIAQAAASGSSSRIVNPSMSYPGFVLIALRSDGWNHASHSSHILSFYEDSTHLQLLRQIVFPSQKSVSSGINSPPGPFVLPTPCFVTLTDPTIDDKPLLPFTLEANTTPFTAGHELLSSLVHITPFTVAGLNHATLLVDILTYVMTNGARHNSVVLTSKQKQILQTRIGFPLFERIMRFFTDDVRSHELLPSNIAFVCIDLLTQMLTLWSGSNLTLLPAQIRGALRGTASVLETGCVTQMATTLAATKAMDESGGSGIASDSCPSNSSAPTLFVRLLWLDSLLCSELLERSKVADMSAVSHSTYHLSILECMTALRLLMSAHTALISPPNFTDPLKFDVVWSGIHLRPLRSHHQRELIAEKDAAVNARQEELHAAFASSLASDPMSESNEGDGMKRHTLLLNVLMAKAELHHVTNAALSPELTTVENMTHLIRKAMGLPRRVPVITEPRFPHMQALRNLSSTPTADAASSVRMFLAQAFGSLINRSSNKAGTVAVPATLTSPIGQDVPAASAASSAPATEVDVDAPGCCQLCDKYASVQCAQCTMSLCSSCDKEWHAPDQMHLHQRLSMLPVADTPAAPPVLTSPSSNSAASNWLCPVCRSDNFAVLRVCHACLTPRLVEPHERAAHAEQVAALLREQVPASAAASAAPGPVRSNGSATVPLLLATPRSESDLSDDDEYISEDDSEDGDVAPDAPGDTSNVSDTNVPMTAEEQLKVDSVTLSYFNFSHSILGELLLGARMEGARWMGIAHQHDDSLYKSVQSTAAPAMHPSLDRYDSSTSQSEADMHAQRQPLAALLLPSAPARFQFFHAQVNATRFRDRNAPDIALDTSQRWEERINDTLTDKSGSSGKKADARSKSKLSLFEQIFAQLSNVSPIHLRGPVGEYSWRTSFTGAADEGAQGYVGMFKQAIAALSTQIARAAFNAASDPPPMLIICPNGTNEVGSNRNQLIINPALLSVGHLKRFYVLGQLLGCALRSSTCIPLDLSRVFWKTLLFGVDALLSGSQEQALHNGLRELKSIDANASNLLSYILNESDRDAFDALSLHYTTFLSGGTTLVDLVPGGSHRAVQYEERVQYVRLVLYTRLNESCAAMQAIRFGMRSIIPSTSLCPTSTRLFGGDSLAEFLPSPSGALHLLRAEELELLVVGSPEVDLTLLKAHTQYKNCSADSEIIRHFWTVLDEYSPEDRSRFLQFVWGRSRLPGNFGIGSTHQHMTINVIELPGWWRQAHPINHNNTINTPPITLEQASGLRLPKSQTCQFIHMHT
jgi:hypothetical protein